MCGGLRKPAGLLPRGTSGKAQGQGQAAGRLAPTTELESEGDDQVEQGRADGAAVQGVPGEGAAHARGGRQGARSDGAGVDAAGPVGRLAFGPAAQEALHGAGRDRSEQADAVDAVVAQGLGLAGFGQAALDRLLERLADVPTPSGLTPRQLLPIVEVRRSDTPQP